MDELTLISHMTGGGEAVASKLRERGLTDLAVLLQKNPEELAKELDVSETMAGKIMTAAGAIRKAEPPQSNGNKVSKADKAIGAAQGASAKIIEGTPTRRPGRARVVPVKRVRRRRYAKALFPILGLVLLGAMLRHQG